jgi:hypothetical protein
MAPPSRELAANLAAKRAAKFGNNLWAKRAARTAWRNWHQLRFDDGNGSKKLNWKSERDCPVEGNPGICLT